MTGSISARGVLAATWLAATGLAACGGGDTPALTPVASTETAPDNLSYPDPNMFTEGVAITPLVPTVKGAPTNYQVIPDLPAGLRLSSTGVISGTPTEAKSPATYLVSAGNSAGTSSFGVRITVMGRFTIGGAVSGLTGTGLVLTNNGGDDLAITANGNFTFSRMVVARSAYNVAVKTQPSGQACTVTNGTGELTNDNFGGVLVNCTAVTPKASAGKQLAVTCPAPPAPAVLQVVVVDRKAGLVTLLGEPNYRFQAAPGKQPAALPGGPKPTVCGPESAAIDASGDWVYVTNLATGTVSAYGRDPN
ncbi:MAG TPA: putative Ig domain-containing protein [Steroidobacteraceae bacterium]|nr:putative Ig domain-containing protein [Steroidobacteraceae bacterium]